MDTEYRKDKEQSTARTMDTEYRKDKEKEYRKDNGHGVPQGQWTKSTARTMDTEYRKD